MRPFALVMLSIILAGSAAGAAEGPRPVLAPAPGGYAAALVRDGLPPGMQDDGDIPPYSAGKAGGLSFLLPGLAQYRMGRAVRASVYFTLEAAGWIAVGASLWQESARRDAYEDYAVALAGVPGTGHEEEYYEKVGGWTSNDGPGGYNEYVRREARDLYYPDLDAMEEYYAQNAITGSMSWRWESDGDRRRFNSLRSGSESAERNALYAAFFLLGLRVVSAVDAVVLARQVPEPQPTGLRFEAGPRPGGFYLALNRPF
ncbi:MAG: hypothetical protein PHQ19_04125 [Candidatus Krumholzibacteria bacterium]|nr:hypothetical protein [Candidatus Krumholzibacteria bacterium]